MLISELNYIWQIPKQWSVT